MTDAQTHRPWLPWVFWGLAASFYCYGFFHRVAPSVMVSELMRDFAVSAAVLGNLSAFYFYAYAGLQLPVGVVMDRFGPRRALTLAAILCGAGSLLFAEAETITTAYIGRLMIGAGAGFTWVGTLKIASDWFEPRRFAMVTGMTLSLGMMGAIFGQAPLAALVDVYGWRASLAGAAVFVFVLGALIFAIVRDGGPRHVPVSRGPGAGILAGLAVTARSGQCWLIAAFGCAMTAPMLAFAGLWGVPFLMEVYDLDRPVAAATTSLVLAGWAIGAPLVGGLSDRIGRRKLPMVIGGTLSMVTFAAVVYWPGLPLVATQILLFLNGLASSVMIISFATVREYTRPESAGSALGFTNMAVMASGAIFQPLIGGLLDAGWQGRMMEGARVYDVEGYQMAFLSLLITGIAGVVAVMMSRETWCRNIHQDLR